MFVQRECLHSEYIVLTCAEEKATGGVGVSGGLGYTEASAAWATWDTVDELWLRFFTLKIPEFNGVIAATSGEKIVCHFANLVDSLRMAFADVWINEVSDEHLARVHIA